MTELRFTSAADLARALRRAAAAHGVHEKELGHFDEGWPEWYADYLMREAPAALRYGGAPERS